MQNSRCVTKARTDQHPSASQQVTINRFAPGITPPELPPDLFGSISNPLEWCFFFDLDGTLLELAPAPDAVTVPDDLQLMLERLSAITEGALAIVTGRSVTFVDQLFPGHDFTVAGLHGAQIRSASPFAQASQLRHTANTRGTASFRYALRAARRLACGLTGVLFEDKGEAFALHYRLAPQHSAAVQSIMAVARMLAGGGYSLQPGKLVVELRPAAGDKGSAVRALMQRPPFRSRRPLAAGDDQTDESMFEAVNELGGLSLRISDTVGIDHQSRALVRLSSPAILRHWIRTIIK
jgi:trehalose 6-phosphate phosphatase